MRAGAQARTIFAGLGVTGSLIGAIGAVFALTGGVLAFTGWPDAPAPRSSPALEGAAATRSATSHSTHAAAIQLPTTPASRTAGARRAPAARPGHTPGGS